MRALIIAIVLVAPAACQPLRPASRPALTEAEYHDAMDDFRTAVQAQCLFADECSAAKTAKERKAAALKSQAAFHVQKRLASEKKFKALVRKHAVNIDGGLFIAYVGNVLLQGKHRDVYLLMNLDKRTLRAAKYVIELKDLFGEKIYGLKGNEGRLEPGAFSIVDTPRDRTVPLLPATDTAAETEVKLVSGRAVWEKPRPVVKLKKVKE